MQKLQKYFCHLGLSLMVLLTLTACQFYKSREFIQQAEYKFEAWNISVTVFAYKSTSKSVWNNDDLNKNFTIFSEISRYPNYNSTSYKASVENMSLEFGKCSDNNLPVRSDPLIKVHEKGRISASYEDFTKIPNNIEFLCIRLEARFRNSSGGNIENKTFSINLKRQESTSLGPAWLD